MEHLTVPQLKLMIHEIKKPWQKLMVAVTFNHGLRVSETLSLTPAHISRGLLMVQRLKGSERTNQKLVVDPDPDFDERDRLLAMIEGKPDTYKLFPMTRSGVYRLMDRAGARAGIDESVRNPHILKHSAAMSLIKTESIEFVRQRLGHKSISSTGEYLKVSDTEADTAYDRSIKARTPPAKPAKMLLEQQPRKFRFEFSQEATCHSLN